MNRQSIEQFVMRYLDATGCHLVEKGEGHVTVRLSPEADKDLMNRSYYWSFVERTGATPEPMTFTFVFDPETWSKTIGQAGVRVAATTGTLGTPDQPPAGDSILGRYFGFVPTGAASRIPNDVMMFGSRRLDQLFSVVQARGRYVRLFEEQKPGQRNPFNSVGYSTWLSVNLKVEFICDMKRDELHSFGINLGSGQIKEGFYDSIKRRSLSPKLPPNIHLEPVTVTLPAAMEMLESQLEQKIKRYDHRWSEEAWKRLKEEWSRIDSYFGELLMNIEPGRKAEVEEQYRAREQEIDWQYRPRIQVSVINCGFFHLADGFRTAIDSNR